MQTLNKTNFQQKLLENNTKLLDVRSLEEQKTHGVISDTQLHIDISQPDSVNEIRKLDKNFTYLIYCWHGVRSRQVGLFMTQNGFPKVYDLEGGIDAWDKETKIQAL